MVSVSQMLRDWEVSQDMELPMSKQEQSLENQDGSSPYLSHTSEGLKK